MKADLTRLTFDPAKHYRGVHQQQGRVQLDSDWNEQAALVSHRIETETVDVIGHCGAPINDDGFRLVTSIAALTPAEAARPGNIAPNPPAPVGDLLITAGRFYAGGVLAINERLVPVSLQPELPTPAELAASGLPPPLRPTGAGTYLAYLDVWPRHRTALEDGSLREVALGGPDTATRTKNTWQVKFLSVPPGTTCASPLPAWDALAKPALGTLSAELVTAPAANSPCIVEPGSGYRRLENQLYRVEVHQGGASLAQTTFKWSRDNGSVVAKWVGKQAGSLDLQIENTGRDKVLGLSENQWVELTDDTREELGVPGLFVQIDKVEGDIVRLKAPHNAATEFAKFPRHPKLRRWEGVPASAAGKWLGPDGNEKALSTAAGAAGLFELEDGVAVRFGAGAFRTGDHWLIPARTARPQLDWPLAAGTTAPAKIPPHGIPHHYCKLAVVTVPSGGAAPSISDCRPLFPPLTELTSLFYVGGDAQSAAPNPTLPPATLLAPLPLPLEVGVANGEHPVVGARIRFTVTSGNGVISGPGVDANGIVLTDANGMARAAWALRNADPAGNPNTGHRVTAELIDPANTRVHLPVVFHATLNTAAKVSYDPKNCAGMSAAQPPVVTVQDALDHLCARNDDAADCCYSVGELDGVPGDFPTLKEALSALFDKKAERSAICLSLLPGEHFLSEETVLEPEDAAVLKINGCNHAARLIIEAPLVLAGFEGVVIRDISIAVGGEEAAIRFEDCKLVEITHCVIAGRAAPALLAFAGVGRLVASKNLLRALAKKAADSNNRGPSSFENIAGARTESDTSKYTAALLAKFEGMSAAERAAAVAKLKTEFALAESKLSPAEAAAYKELLELLAGSSSSDANALSKKVAALRKLSAKRRATEFADLTRVSKPAAPASAPEAAAPVAGVRAPGAIAADANFTLSIGVAILFEDAEADVTLDDNYILGEVRHLGDGTEKGPLTEAEFKNFGPLFTSGAITLRPASLGFLRVRGNTVVRFASGDALADQIRELIKNKKGELALWAGAQFSDNRFGGLDNSFVAVRLMLTANQFAGGGSGTDGNAQDVALAIATRATFTGNVSGDRTYIRQFITQAAEAANLGFTFHPALP